MHGRGSRPPGKIGGSSATAAAIGIPQMIQIDRLRAKLEEFFIRIADGICRVTDDMAAKIRLFIKKVSAAVTSACAAAKSKFRRSAKSKDGRGAGNASAGHRKGFRFGGDGAEASAAHGCGSASAGHEEKSSADASAESADFQDGTAEGRGERPNSGTAFAAGDTFARYGDAYSEWAARSAGGRFVCHLLDFTGSLLFCLAVIVAMKPLLLSAFLEDGFQPEIEILFLTGSFGEWFCNGFISELPDAILLLRNFAVSVLLIFFIALKAAAILACKNVRRIVPLILLAATPFLNFLLFDKFLLFLIFLIAIYLASQFSLNFSVRSVMVKLALLFVVSAAVYFALHFMSSYSFQFYCYRTARCLRRIFELLTLPVQNWM